MELFGFPPPLWEPEDASPHIDEELLRQYVRGELEEEQRHRILTLSLRFWSWAQATVRISSEEFRNRKH